MPPPPLRPRRREEPPPRRRFGPVALTATLVVGISALMAGVAALIALAAPEPAPRAGEPPPVKVELADLLEEWRRNPAEVVSRHRGKALEVVGRVEKISGGAAFSYVTLSPAEERTDTLEVDMSRDQIAAMKDYPIGSLVRLRVTAERPTSRPTAKAVAVLPP